MGAAALSSLLNEPYGVARTATAAVFASDAKQVYALAPTGELAIIDGNTGRVTTHREGGSRLLSTATLILVVGAHSLVVVDRATGREVQTLRFDDASALSVAVSRDGSRVLAGGGASIHILDGSTGKTVASATALGRVAAAWLME